MISRSIQMDIDKEPKKNIEKAIELATSQSIEKIDLLVFPELFTTGFQLERINDLAHDKDDPIFQIFSKFAKENNVNIVLGSIAYKTNKGVSNTSFVINRNGEIISQYSKLHLFKLMNEEKHLIPGNHYHFFEIDGITCTSIVCYDMRFPELTRRLFHEKQPKLLVVPMEWPAPRTETFKALLRARAIENQCFVVTSNRIGTENGAEFEGFSLAADPFGNIINELPFKEGIMDVELDFEIVDKVRKNMTCFGDRRLDLFNN
jgi:omega-amidase